MQRNFGVIEKYTPILQNSRISSYPWIDVNTHWPWLNRVVVSDANTFPTFFLIMESQLSNGMKIVKYGLDYLVQTACIACVHVCLNVCDPTSEKWTNFERKSGDYHKYASFFTSFGDLHGSIRHAPSLDIILIWEPCKSHQPCSFDCFLMWLIRYFLLSARSRSLILAFIPLIS